MLNARPPIARLATPVALGVVVFASMGASCSPRIGSPFGVASSPAPTVLGPTSTAADVVAAVNANSSRVQTYQAQNASISLPESAGLPLVSASIAVERPRRFRLRATTAITGPEIDLGSNDERFWIWARRNEPPALHTARHDLWAGSPMRSQVPIEPAWLIDALGLVQLDPNAAYAGPLPRENGTFEIRAQVAGPDGPQQRVFVVDSLTAQVQEQHVYDAAGSLMASVFADRFQYDAATQVSLPERVRLSVPGAGLNLTINTGGVVVNAPIADGGQLWTMPQMEGYPLVDLTGPGGVANATPAGPWDLTGVGSTYGRTAPIATPYASMPSESAPPRAEAASPGPATSTYANTAPSPYASPYTDSPGPAASGLAAPVAAPTAPSSVAAQPVALPQASGFVGLPAGGRALE